MQVSEPSRFDVEGNLLKATARVVLFLCAGAFACVGVGGELLRYPQESVPRSLSLPDLAGQQHELERYRGSVVLVNFWASWCPPCLTEMPGMQRLFEALAGRPFQILAVNKEETKSRVWKFRKLLNITFPTLLDSRGEITRAWEVEIFPTSYLLDTSGAIRYVSYGALEWDSAVAIEAIETLMPDHAPSTSTAASVTH